MKTLRIITILSLVQFIAFTSFGKVNSEQRVSASLATDRAVSLLEPSWFASIAEVEAEAILESVVSDTRRNYRRVSYEKMDKRIEALLKAVHATGKSSFYQHLAFLKTETFKGNLDRVLKKIKSSDRRAAQVMEVNLDSDSVI